MRKGLPWLALLLAGVGQAVIAFPRLTLEREPNDTPDTAQELRGEARLIGEVLTEDRDLFRWRLDDDDVDHLWRVELLADDGAGVSLEVEPFSAQTQAPAGIATFGSVAESESPNRTRRRCWRSRLSLNIPWLWKRAC